MVDKNRATNEAAYEAWVKSHTPLQIKEANSARKALSRDGKKKLPQIKDDRQVKRPTVAFLQFTKERGSRGDFKSMAEIQAEAGKEWKQMSESEKEVSSRSPAFFKARQVTNIVKHSPISRRPLRIVSDTTASTFKSMDSRPAAAHRRMLKSRP